MLLLAAFLGSTPLTVELATSGSRLLARLLTVVTRLLAV